MDYIKPHLKLHQRYIVSLYPLTMVFAFLYSQLGSPPPSYFSNKRNIFNVFFVKVGWFWVTLVYFSYLFFVYSKRLKNTQAFVSGCARYLFVTLYWYLMTQWLLGPSFIDRVYVLTGGKCSSLLQNVDLDAKLANVVEQQVCRRLGGQWTGGHDVSGHCVLLIHASLFLWEELSWLFYDAKPVMNMQQRDRIQYGTVMAVLALLALWWTMLMMTGVYFHGQFEILSGTMFGILGWAILYLGAFPKIAQIGTPMTRIE
ncbi:inositol phospholipid synthesis and fat-storage-inducing TM-domain-containing protein [Choanephora cucurbitarum]|nr:inositol phospholipid synthesis and fat-storage-inducing TM-domain-containing protein [Choanephora cucurbitarum]